MKIYTVLLSDDPDVYLDSVTFFATREAAEREADIANERDLRIAMERYVKYAERLDRKNRENEVLVAASLAIPDKQTPQPFEEWNRYNLKWMVHEIDVVE